MSHQRPTWPIFKHLLVIVLMQTSINQLSNHAVGVNGAKLITQAPSVSSKSNTADLSLLINETLAINNKTLTQEADKSTIKDEWTFDMVEYDLMEFLQDLGARYQLNNRSLIEEHTRREQSQLEAKSSTTNSSLTTTINLDSKPVASPSVHNNTSNNIESSIKADPPLATQALSEPTSTNLPHKPTEVPILSTSLASGDHEIAESSWQYGIFDRFTRPKSTTTSTTPEPKLLLDENGRVDMRNFNTKECGLRAYEEEVQYYPQQMEVEAIKELNQRRQRLPLSPSEQKRFQSEFGDKDLEEQSEKKFMEWANTDDDGFKQPTNHADSPSSSATDFGSENEPPSSDSVSNSEFNLSSRRYWLQQQLGNTLQLLGFNVSSQSTADFLNQTYATNVNSRENMMKKYNKLGKATNFTPTEKDRNQELASRQDELKLEARVIGGSDARLGDSPWSVSLQALVSRPGTGGIEYRHYCGGTIISEYYVLTAAHCLDFMVGRESRLFVVVGDLNWRMSAASVYGRRFGIEKLIIHSGYKSTAFGHDIGLIRTKESMKPFKVKGRYIVNSVCLPEKGVEHTGEAELVGWGLFSNRNEMADSLQIADVPILPRPLCVDLYRRRTGLIQWLIGIELITDKQVCAGTFGRGICQGDSGSALVFNEKISKGSQLTSKSLRAGARREDQTRATIIGVVAFGGIRRCSYQSLPGVYMQTSKYMDWILPRIQN